MDLDDNATRSPEYLERMVDRIHRQCRIPVLFNDSSSASDSTGRDDLGRKLSLKLTALTSRA